MFGSIEQKTESPVAGQNERSVSGGKASQPPHPPHTRFNPMKKVLIALFALGSLSVASISATQAAPSFGGGTWTHGASGGGSYCNSSHCMTW